MVSAPQFKHVLLISSSLELEQIYLTVLRATSSSFAILLYQYPSFLKDNIWFLVSFVMTFTSFTPYGEFGHDLIGCHPRKNKKSLRFCSKALRKEVLMLHNIGIGVLKEIILAYIIQFILTEVLRKCF